MARAEPRRAERPRDAGVDVDPLDPARVVTDPGDVGESGPVVVEAVLRASRVLVAVAARSLAEVAEEVTLAQYRALVVIASKGPQRVAGLADALEVTPPTATRMCDRLVRKGLVRRRTAREDRREVRLYLTSEGNDLVTEVTRRRRDEIATLLERIPPASQRALVDLFDAFADAAGEPDEGDWALGWEL
jgi:DNA-binding MarR family transcriptional regulator